MKSVLRFEQRYDVDRLLADLHAAEQFGRSHVHFGKYHDGGWSAIPLVSPGGAVDASSLRHAAGASYEKTPILRACPYFEEIVDSFRCPWLRVRLMRLEPGANILEHRDPGDSWALGQVRLHIPIVTHDEVYFYVDRQRVTMRPGELWYCDFSRPHSVANRGDVARVHFVLDLVANGWMREFFPRESVVEQVGNLAYRLRFYATDGLREALWTLRHPRRQPEAAG